MTRRLAALLPPGSSRTLVPGLLAVGLAVPEPTRAQVICTEPGGSVFRAASDPGYGFAGVRCKAVMQETRAEDPVVDGSVLLPPATPTSASAQGVDAPRHAAGGGPTATVRSRDRVESLTPLIEAAARTWGHDPALLHAVVAVESSYKPDAVSPKGAIGLMQVMPATARRYGVSDPATELRDPKRNVELGARHLASLKKAFDGDLRLALAGYNAGEQAVINNGRRVPPFPETRAYVRDVIDRYLAFKRCPSISECLR